MIPFSTLYGCAPPTISDYISRYTTIITLDTIMKNRQEIVTLIKKNLTKSREHMATQANKKRVDFTFEVGDFVLLLLQPYMQQ